MKFKQALTEVVGATGMGDVLGLPNGLTLKQGKKKSKIARRAIKITRKKI
jgi:hypothetical protein